MSKDKAVVLVRGGGDLASGVVLRLHRSGIRVVVCELPEPLAVRRAVSFAEAVYEGTHTVEGVTARLVEPDQISAVLEAGEIPIIIDPQAELLSRLPFLVVVDARLIKKPAGPLPVDVPLHLGLGPGFHAGENCDAVVETRRSHTLGRVFWHGSAQEDSGQPEGDPKRVLRAPGTGIFVSHKKIAEHCEVGELVGEIASEEQNQEREILAPLSGVLRGLIRDGIRVTQGLKLGDIDPRDDPGACFLVSDKSLAIGGGVLEAMLSRQEIRDRLWTRSAHSSEGDLRLAPPPTSG